jgi:hypothetical protein
MRVMVVEHDNRGWDLQFQCPSWGNPVPKLLVAKSTGAVYPIDFIVTGKEIA